jgi:hypothetical protein
MARGGFGAASSGVQNTESVAHKCGNAEGGQSVGERLHVFTVDVAAERRSTKNHHQDASLACRILGACKGRQLQFVVVHDKLKLASLAGSWCGDSSHVDPSGWGVCLRCVSVALCDGFL